MSRASTFFQRNDSELISKEFAVSYAHIDFDIPTETRQRGSKPVSNVFLQWTPNQEVVSLPKTTFYTQTGKRILDIAVSILVIVFVLSWLIPVIGALIVTESAGPVFFIQARSGRRGQAFRCFKFRTMINAPQGQQGFRQTARNDNRVTALGRFLRRTNLDEMPQFINVLLGDMSLVGPRPHAIQHDILHWDSTAYRERYWVRPGITGLAQVRGARGATGDGQWMEHRVRYDHLYIPRQSFLLDMKICFRTVKLMFKGDGNAW
ncbi:sugar transferase [Spirosoma sp. HMF3257]|uniref:Sugar transferase n=1 Tax=Spirosoma telluris TaxID=2183553 RepID=A0A327NHH8_9BACT|nr:sugar transferase [Spirosoma telluris]RAI74712.1 sugar transferase [Spirosoma telluris]